MAEWSGWRQRLRFAVNASGRKRWEIARDAGIAPETLSRVLNAAHARPEFETVVRIAYAIDEPVGFLLGESEAALRPREKQTLAAAIRLLTALERRFRGEGVEIGLR